MNWILVLLAVAIVANTVILILFWRSRKSEEKNGDKSEGLLLLQHQMRDLDKNINDNIKEIIKGVTRVDETGKQMVSFADQLQSLQDILKNPKQRGVLCEYYLETLLKNILPPGSYQMQYGFSDGMIVDAAVFVREKIIPVDSKFSLENYNRLSEEKNPQEKE